MKPRPLDLEDIKNNKNNIKSKLFSSLNNKEWCDYCSWYDRQHKECSVIGHPDDFGDDKTLSHTALCFLNWKLNRLKEFKQRTKFACEFYFKYKNNPELLIKKHPEFKEDVEKIRKEWYNWEYHYDKWLFKLLFKGIFKEGEKEMKSVFERWKEEISKEIMECSSIEDLESVLQKNLEWIQDGKINGEFK